MTDAKKETKKDSGEQKEKEAPKAAPKAKKPDKAALLKELENMKTLNTPRAKDIVVELLK